MSKVLEIKNLSFSYKNYAGGEKKYNDSIFSSLNLILEAGEKILIVGAPNVGKTTLSLVLTKAIDKYIKGKLTGDIFLEDQNLKNLQPWDLVNLLAIIEQNTSQQLIASTVLDEIAFPFESIGMDKSSMKERITQGLTEWKLEDKKDFNPQLLSGGEKKRLLLAISFALNPKIIVFDETFDELDEYWKNYLIYKIKNSNISSIVLQSKVNISYEGIFNKVFKLENKKLTMVDEKTLLEEKIDFKPFINNVDENNFVSVENAIVEHKPGFKLSIPNFILKKGEVVGLIGKNGSGKTTFARTICGLDKLSQGKFSIPENNLPLKIGYLFQNPDYQIFLPTVKDELAYPPNSKITEEEINNTCSLFSIDPTKNASLISYPERKRLQAAVYYQLNRDFYILDEMESSLDNSSSHQLIELLRKKNAGILIITHEKEVKEWCHRTYFIKDGILQGGI